MSIMKCKAKAIHGGFAINHALNKGVCKAIWSGRAYDIGLMRDVHSDTPAVECDSYACWSAREEDFHAAHDDEDTITLR